MSRLKIHGPRGPLRGVIPWQGSKNVSMPFLIAAALCLRGASVQGVPHLRDTQALLLEIDEAVARLGGDMERDPDLEFDEVSADDDPLNHRETLSPDSDELEEIEEDDQLSLSDGSEPLPDDVLDPEEWSDGDGFNVDRGVK